jgi:hypothetical protein
MTTEEGNRLIAEFMEWRYSGEYIAYGMLHRCAYYSGNMEWDGLFGITPNGLRFNLSWNWFMHSYKKFREEILITEWWDDNANDHENITIQYLEESIIEADINNAFRYLCEIIQWYNTTKKKTNGR